MSFKRIGVLGGGLSGLSQALKQENLGHQVHLIESSKRLGGVLQSINKDGYLLDYGANTLSLRLQRTAKTLDSYGVLPHAINANPEANKRFIVRKGRLIALPTCPFSFLSNPFLSPWGKMRLLLEPLLPKGKSAHDESVAQFITRRLGKEALEYCMNPFISGIYASKPESLSLSNAFPTLHQMERDHRSLFLAFLSQKSRLDRLPKTRLISFEGGMEDLIIRMADHFKGEVSLGCRVLEINRLDNGWKVLAKNEDQSQNEWVFDEVICTLPSHALTEISWKNLKGSDQISGISETREYPLNLVYLGFDASHIKHPLDGFGFLVPERENLSILGSLFSSTLFPGRAPEGKVLLTTFIGGEGKPELTQLEDEQTYELVLSELSQLLGISGKPCFRHLKRWSRGIPLPDFSMRGRIESRDSIERSNPNLHITGAHLTGVSLPNCIDGI